jgi:alanine or glycine:cation symporter, AGCS family
LKKFEELLIKFGDAAWGTPLLVLLMGGGIFFLMYSRFLPFRYFKHAIGILSSKPKEDGAPGDLSPFQALSTAVASTVGMGNISGVAVAITMGGPGAIFWMWMSAFVGMATNFFTCAAAVMFRGKDTNGKIEGGPMYVITEGLGPKWKPLAVFFCIAGIFGALPVFQANQFTQLIRESILVPMGYANDFKTSLFIGLAVTVLVSTVIFGGVKRIGAVAARLVPFMVVLYFGSVSLILLTNLPAIPASFLLIIEDAFTGEAVLGGSVGAIILAGARRAAFSNEAGIGTSPMAIGAVKSNEPIKDGLIAMLSPSIDTLLVCTLTALAILVTGVWQTSDTDGVTLTMTAFSQALPGVGKYLLVSCAAIFSLTTMFTYSYYGTKCTSFLLGAHRAHWYNYLYVGTIVLGAVASLSSMVGLIDGSFALMAIPTMVSGILLAPRIWTEARKYFNKVDEEAQKRKLIRK